LEASFASVRPMRMPGSCNTWYHGLVLKSLANLLDGL
jgi:hypothetical protein